ncbi:hypothetical protein YC2023_059507 [Brassica napus]
MSVSLIGVVSFGGSYRRPLPRWSDVLVFYVVCWFCLSVGLLVEAFPQWLKSKLSTQIERGTSHTPAAMEARKPIVCGLLARGMIPPPLPQEDTDDEVVEISDEEADMVELSSDEYRRNIGYLIRVEQAEEDSEPQVRRLLQRMHEEEKKLREEKFKAMKAGIKFEEGQYPKVDGKKRKRRS